MSSSDGAPSSDYPVVLSRLLAALAGALVDLAEDLPLHLFLCAFAIELGDFDLESDEPVAQVYGLVLVAEDLGRSERSEAVRPQVGRMRRGRACEPSKSRMLGKVNGQCALGRGTTSAERRVPIRRGRRGGGSRH
jgi:hypothetical protein